LDRVAAWELLENAGDGLVDLAGELAGLLFIVGEEIAEGFAAEWVAVVGGLIRVVAGVDGFLKDVNIPAVYLLSLETF
jgi:hypothetical protein